MGIAYWCGSLVVFKKMNRVITWIAVAALLLMKRSTKKTGTGGWTSNFSESEFIPAGDINTIPAGARESLRRIAVDVLQPVRNEIGVPLRITSAYRNPAKNAAVGGAKSSMHLTGQGVDIKPIPATKENFTKLWAALGKRDYDQLIWENATLQNVPSHIHLSYVVPGVNPQSWVGVNRFQKYYYLGGKYYLL
jgi:hypothetical protein